MFAKEKLEKKKVIKIKSLAIRLFCKKKHIEANEFNQFYKMSGVLLGISDSPAFKLFLDGGVQATS